MPARCVYRIVPIGTDVNRPMRDFFIFLFVSCGEIQRPNLRKRLDPGQCASGRGRLLWRVMTAPAFSAPAPSDEQIAVQTRHRVGCECGACASIRRQGPQIAKPNGYLSLLGEQQVPKDAPSGKTKPELRREARARIKARRLRGQRFAALMRDGRFAPNASA